MFQIYTDKTVTSLKANVIDAYPVHFLLLIFTKPFCWFLIENGCTFARYLTICTINDEPDEKEENVENQVEAEPSIGSLYETILRSIKHDAPDMMLYVPHEAMQRIFPPFSDCVCAGSLENMRGRQRN